MNSVVLDASAILAVAFKEAGNSIVIEQQSRAIVSAVNHAEVVSKLLRFQMPRNEIAFLDFHSQIALALHSRNYVDFLCSQAIVNGQLFLWTSKYDFFASGAFVRTRQAAILTRRALAVHAFATVVHNCCDSWSPPVTAWYGILRHPQCRNVESSPEFRR